jgi:hypothetical protein
MRRKVKNNVEEQFRKPVVICDYNKHCLMKMLRVWARRKSEKKVGRSKTDVEVATPVLGSPEEEAFDEIEKLMYENMEREQVKMTRRFRVVELQEKLYKKTIVMEAALRERISAMEIKCEQRYRE